MQLKRIRIPGLAAARAWRASLKALPDNIRRPLLQMSAVFGSLLALGAWQTEFVFHAILSNVYLNASIWGTFLFGVVLTYRNILRMKNEHVAFEALKEMYADAKQLREGEVKDPMWRYYRCNDLAVVFEKPEVLGHAFQLISEELSTGKDVHVSTATMQTLIESIQARLDERRSLSQYISGILILLGLIGTFIGLMETLASVGKILGDLDITGKDTTGAIGTLLTNLQIPLRGMSTGFSSSLFGAIGSLVLSMMVRFSGMAYAHFTQDFEEWLSNIVRIGEEGDEDEVVVQAPGTPMMEAKHLAQVLRAARISVSSNARLNAQLDALSDTMVQLTGVIQGQTHAVQSVLGGVAELQEHAGILSQAMARNLDTVRSVASGLDERHEVVEATMMLSRQLQSRDQALANSLSTLDQTLSMLRHREAEAARLPTPQSDEAFRLLEELKASLLEGEMGKVRDRLWGEDSDDPTRAERERAPHRAVASQGAAR
jgi:hypothetical protein